MVYASVAGFEAEPKKVLDWYVERRKRANDAQPNNAHRALASHPSMMHITQNVDRLLERAGASDVMHLHGTLDRDRCHNRCGYTASSEGVALPTGPVQLCPSCGGMLRPDVVWFGEQLPLRTFERAEDACKRADVLMVIGTSASVWPAAGLVERAANATIVSINLEYQEADISLVGLAGDILPQLL